MQARKISEEYLKSLPEGAVSYDKIRPCLQTGDIVLFSGKGHISELIKRFSGGEYSHIGIVIKLQNYVFILESTTLSNLKDEETHEFVKGVQLVPLFNRLASYEGYAGIRLLDHAITQEEEQKISDFRHEMKGRPYEKSDLELLNAAYDGFGGQNSPDLSSVFCSELVAELFQELGWLSKDDPPNEYTPQDFAKIDELCSETIKIPLSKIYKIKT